MSQPNLETMSTDELRALAMQWAGDATPKPAEEVEQPRDDQGRFTPKVEEPVVTEPQEEIIYERTIDLGDGSGVQVFEAKSMEELVDKLAKAQENATRKIREQETRLRTIPKAAPTPAPDEIDALSDAEKFLLQQEVLTDPANAIQKFVNRAVEKRERVAAQAAERTKSATDSFIANTSDYFASQKNGQKMVKWLEINNLEVSEDSLKSAFEDLNSSGLLERKPAEAKETPVVPVVEQPVEARIEPTPVTSTVVRRKVVGGVSVKRSAPTPVQTPGLTEEQMYKMPMHELEELSRKALLGQQ